MKPQQKIDVEVCAARILELMIHYDLVRNHPVLYQMLRIDEDTIDAAIRWLRRKAFIWHRDPTFVTDEGREYYEGACRRSEVGNAADAHKWKVEALTGIVEKRSRQSGHTVTEQSEIERAALPKGQPDNGSIKNPEEIYSGYQDDLERRKRVAKLLKLTLGEYDGLSSEGRIRACNGSGKEHLGIFNGENDKVCRKCRKRGKR